MNKQRTFSLELQAIRFYFLAVLILLLPKTLYADEPQSYQACNIIEFYSREGCPHCAAATKFLDALQIERPALVVNKIDINESEASLKKFISESKRLDIARPGVPLIVICEAHYLGYDADETSGKAILSLLDGQAQEAPVESPRSNDSSRSAPEDSQAITLPIIGTLSISDVGLPLLTVVIGLIDGFNPCAMWVLLFILSLVVNIKDRTKVILIAGTFVLVSGLVYFAFMAAWLNVFKVIGWSRPLQLILALFALCIAVVHIKDFFAFKQGISLSIPDKFKPAIYKQSRKVLKQHNLLLSMSAVAVLAVMVNFIELLCTAGLPALYTQILVQQSVSEMSYYGYLALYNLAYIFDDGLMVMIAVVTLRHNKLQEQQGKWLKLLSGITILMLALLLLFAPSWLF